MCSFGEINGETDYSKQTRDREDIVTLGSIGIGGRWGARTPDPLGVNDSHLNWSHAEPS